MTDIVADRTGLAPGRLPLPWPCARPSIHDVATGPGAAAIDLRTALEDARGSDALAALEAAILAPTPEAIGRLYAAASDEAVLTLVELRLSALARKAALPEAARSSLGRRLATSASDPGPVRLGIGLLGFSADRADAAILMALGRCATFAKPVALALGRLLPEAERDAAWWTLAQRHGGSARIAFVRCLSRTRDPAIKGWLLRDGFRDVTLDLYLAYTCATGGDLWGALRADTIDDALLRGAIDIVTALMSDAFRPSMRHYVDGPAVVRLLLGHLAQRKPAELDHARLLHQVIDYVAGERWTGALARFPWRPADARAIGDLATGLLADPGWRSLVEAALDGAEPFAFSLAVRLAESVGIDSWEHRLARLQRGAWSYTDLFETDDPARIDRLIEIAVADLAAPDGMRMGGAVIGLRRVPGRGWTVIAGALASRLSGLRTAAVETLAAWGCDAWPAPARDALEAALAIETDAHLAGNMRRVLVGDPIIGKPYVELWEKHYPFSTA